MQLNLHHLQQKKGMDKKGKNGRITKKKAQNINFSLDLFGFFGLAWETSRPVKTGGGE